MERLKRVLNFLLWTADVPEVGEDIKVCLMANQKTAAVKVNIQCAAHMVVVSGLLARRGFQPVTRRGMAFVIESSPDRDPSKALLNQIAIHFWFTLEDHGLVDLSLHGELESPLVYCNRTPGNRWLIDFSHDGSKVDPFKRAKRQGCLYLTLGKKTISPGDLEQSLGKCFAPAEKAGIQLTYAKLVDYCERVLVGAEDVREGKTQIEAWRRLAT